MPIAGGPSRHSLVRAAACAAGTSVGMSANVQGGINTVLAAIVRDGGNITQAADNDHVQQCGTAISSLLLAAWVSFITGVSALLTINICNQLWRYSRGEPLSMRPPGHWWEMIGGLLGCSVMVLTLAGLAFTGYALTSVLRAAGTTAAAILLDRVGCLGTQKRRLTARRGFGFLLLILGASLSACEELAADFAEAARTGVYIFFALGMPLLAGGLLPLQAAVNGRLAKRLGWPLRATLVSFIGGVACLSIAVGVCGAPAHSAGALIRAPLWAFTGGLIGFIMVSANFILPRYIGFATLSSFVTFGNLASSLVFDAAGAFGFVRRPPTLLRSAGVALVLMGALLTTCSRPQTDPADAKSLLAAAEVRSDSIQMGAVRSSRIEMADAQSTDEVRCHHAATPDCGVAVPVGCCCVCERSGSAKAQLAI